MQFVPVRTITLGLEQVHPLTPAIIVQAASILRLAQQRFEDAGYEVQTTRLSTRPVFDDLVDWSSAALLRYARELQELLDANGLSFCSLGTAQVTKADFALDRLPLIADLLASTTALSATVQLATSTEGIRTDAALPTAQIIKRLAEETEEGFGNFRFAMLACVPPGGPFFPAAYHAGPGNLSIGLQGAGIVAQALRGQSTDEILLPDHVTRLVRDTLLKQATPVVALAQEVAQAHGLPFGGIDLSPAPLGEDSIVTALELCGFGAFGAPGTLTYAASLTAALKSTGLPTCGYCGLMLPVLEDAWLGRRWEEGRVTPDQLLLYSAVCGTGFDTLPLPGDIAAESIAHMLLDVASLAVRLNKPLSARLFPVPGKQRGERTTFTSPYLTNTLIN